jgi:hypothetical protein
LSCSQSRFLGIQAGAEFFDLALRVVIRMSTPGGLVTSASASATTVTHVWVPFVPFVAVVLGGAVAAFFIIFVFLGHGSSWVVGLSGD